MEWIKSASDIAAINEDEKKYLIHEVKYALLGSSLLIVFTVRWTDQLIGQLFPGAKGPLLIVYKVLLYIALYYIIQKTSWFQNL